MEKPEKTIKWNSKKIIGIIIFWLCIWQVAALLIDNALLFAGPIQTTRAFFLEVCSGKFMWTIVISLLRILAGFIAAFVLGCLLGFLSFRIPFFEEFLSPFMLLCKAVPVASFAVMLLIWWGAEWLSTAICFLVVMPMVYVNFLKGLHHADKKLLHMAEVFNIPAVSRMFYIYRPAFAPFMEGCLKTSLSMGIKAGVAAEVIGIPKWSIGGELYLSKIYLDTAGVFAWTATVIALSFFMEKVVLYLWNCFCKYKHPVRFSRRADKGSLVSKLVLEGIHITYENQSVLRNISKELIRGKIYCLMAPSGVGKTTLLHILAGIVKADTGRVSAYRADGSEIEKLRVSMVFQEDRLCMQETAITNVELVCGDREKAIHFLIEFLPKNVLNRPVENLSGGMRRRVCLARALAAEAEVLFMDEPFTGHDEANKEKAAGVIRKYQGDRLIVAATHEAGDVKKLQGEIWQLLEEKEQLNGREKS